jgi:undecaprenyl-diphosphatase
MLLLPIPVEQGWYMDNLFTAFLLSIVEGLTEFLPVSSSGHLILAGNLLGFVGEKAASFEVVIQLGAILAVVVLYRKRFYGLVRPQPYLRFAGMRGIMLLALTSLPACIVGFFLHSFIKTHLFQPLTVLLALVVGALCMIGVEYRKFRPNCVSLDEISPGLALGIGCFQCLALWPGFSRSAATIMGGMLLGAKRSVAAEYSFIAAVPVMVAATLYDLWKSWHLFSSADILFFTVGMVGSFFSALLAVKVFIALVGRITLVPFAVYRLCIAPLVFYFMV